MLTVANTRSGDGRPLEFRRDEVCVTRNGEMRYEVTGRYI